MIKFSLKPDRDRLSYTPKPYRDWVAMFLVFVVMLILLGLLHWTIFLSLENIKNADGNKVNQAVIDEVLLDQAADIINKRAAEFNR